MGNTFLNFYGHFRCMADDRLVKNIYGSRAEGTRSKPQKMERCSERTIWTG